jgi:glucose/arabinose dehydrogenase
VRKVPTTGEFSKYWSGDLLVGSLKGKQLRRLKISAKNTVMYDEPIYVGNRIRSFDILSDGRLLCATDEGTIVLLSDTQLVGTGEFPPKS